MTTSSTETWGITEKTLSQKYNRQQTADVFGYSATKQIYILQIILSYSADAAVMDVLI